MRQDLTFDSKFLNFDREHIWHPYTSLTKPLKTYPIVATKGVNLVMDDGRKLIDGMSSWWTAIHGYNVPELNEAAQTQLKLMSHVMFGGITHEPAIRLAKQLIELSPSQLEKVFFCDSGSVAVEVAMKMAVQYQHAKGLTGKTKFLTFRGGYHGDTTGAMSVCDPDNGMHHLFTDFLPKHHFAEMPKLGFETIPSADEIKQLGSFFEDHANEAAAFILEPVVQGAGGMRIYSTEYLRQVRSLCDKYHLLLIADEIATGFGRTGKMFACEHAQIQPDIMCIGKALTGGYVSLAATLCSTEVAVEISNGEAGVFMHGPTFMANPLSCAIAVKSIELLLNSDWQQRVCQLEKQMQAELEVVRDHPDVKDVRVLGAIGVVEMNSNVAVEAAQAYFVENGVWVRPFRNLIYIMPPYVITEDELKQLTKTITEYITSK